MFAKIQRILLKRVTPHLLNNAKKEENSFRRKDFDDEFWFINTKMYGTMEKNVRNLVHADGILAGKPSNTFLKAIEKVLDGFVKNGGVWH